MPAPANDSYGIYAIMVAMKTIRALVVYSLILGLVVMGRLHIVEAAQPESETCLDDGYTAFINQHYEDAVEFFTCAIDADPDSAKAYTGRAQAYSVLDEFGLALDDTAMAIMLDEYFPRAYAVRVNAYHGLGSLEQAIAEIDQALWSNEIKFVGKRIRQKLFCPVEVKVGAVEKVLKSLTCITDVQIVA
jgi:tetratricopeptide (TPR) repeat protein